MLTIILHHKSPLNAVMIVIMKVLFIMVQLLMMVMQILVMTTIIRRKKCVVFLFALNVPAACKLYSRHKIFSDNVKCCHTETEAADQNCCPVTIY